MPTNITRPTKWTEVVEPTSVRWLGLSHRDRLRLEVRLQPVVAVFSPDPRLLEPSERRPGFMGEGIDQHTVCLDLRRHTCSTGAVAGELVGMQAVGRVVGDGDGFGLVAVGNDAKHRTE